MLLWQNFSLGRYANLIKALEKQIGDVKIVIVAVVGTEL
jgi:hypothetical protein